MSSVPSGRSARATVCSLAVIGSPSTYVDRLPIRPDRRPCQARAAGVRPSPAIFVSVPDVNSLNPFRTLQRHRNFRLFWFGQTLSLVGTWMQSMAQGWLALQLSNSALLVAL